MKKLKTLLINTASLLLASCLLVSPSMAANRGKSFSISPMIGGYVFEGNQDLDNTLTYSLGLGYNLTDTWSTEFVLNYFRTDTRENQRSSVDGLVYRLDALYHFMPGKTLVPYLAGGLGGISMDTERGGSSTNFLLDYGIGLKYFLTQDLALRGDVRHILAFGDPENNFTYSAGLTYLVGGRPAEPPRPLRSDSAGLPVAATDSAGILKAAPRTPSDKDLDGVYDRDDRWPNVPLGVAVDQDDCPQDKDGDGVPDNLDACPGTPPGLLVDDQGCPVSLTLSVEFDVDKYDIKPRYHDELTRGAEFIKRFVQHKILVAGHTDSTGSEPYNEALSHRRAESVRDYLVAHFGIDGEMLLARGFGETAPIADNDTVEGRQLNRRVELACCVAPR